MSILHSSPFTTLLTLPYDVHYLIALFTLSPVPLSNELSTIHSLILTCRVLHRALTISFNTSLYATIFRLMFDTQAIERRLGRTALRPSVLAQELQYRLSLFKRVHDAFNPIADCIVEETPLSDILIIDLTYLYLIMTENDEKNEVQLRELARSCHVSVNGAWTERSTYSNIPRLQLTTLFLSIISLLEIDDVSSETSEHRSAILDIMEPWALEVFEDPFTTQPYYFYSVLGPRCRLKPVSLVYLARQCTSARYFTTNRRDKARQGQIKTYLSPSMRFDDDWTNHVHISSSTPHHVPDLDSVHLSQKSTGTWNGSWEGALIVPSIIDPLQPCQIFTCACPLQMNIREYVSIDESQFVSYVTKGDDTSTNYSDETLVEIAWLPKGVRFEEFRNVLRIYDPIKMRWVTYHSAMDYKEKDKKHMSIVDTILIGETDSTHHGNFSFYGRINPYCFRLALIRTPTDPQSQGLGTWVLYGEARRGVNFWGNWRASLTKPVPAAHGWFYLTKNNETQL